MSGRPVHEAGESKQQYYARLHAWQFEQAVPAVIGERPDDAHPGEQVEGGGLPPVRQRTPAKRTPAKPRAQRKPRK
jgi:hypothetical protein